MEYYFADGNQQRGPHAPEELASLGLKPDTLVWHDGMTDWLAASTLPELASLFNSADVAASSQAANQSNSGTVIPAPSIAAANSPASLAAPPLGYQTYNAAGGNQNGMAIAALVLGIVALVTMLCDGLGIIPGILAIIFGVMARRQIRRTDAQGYGMATAGLICGSIAAGLVVLIATIIVIAIAVSH